VRITAHDVKDMLEVLNAIDMCTESFLNTCTDEEAALYGPVWTYMTH
jgi:hypothetical protein